MKSTIQSTTSTKAQWRTQCSQDRLFSWYQSRGALAAVADIQSRLDQEAAVHAFAQEETTRVARAKLRREKQLLQEHKRADARRAVEVMLRSRDPAFQRLQHSRSSSRTHVSGNNEQKPVKQMNASSSEEQHCAPAVAAPQVDAFRRRPWSASSTRLSAIETLLLEREPQPTSVAGHFLRLHPGGADWRAAPIPSPPVQATPRTLQPERPTSARPASASTRR